MSCNCNSPGTSASAPTASASVNVGLLGNAAEVAPPITTVLSRSVDHTVTIRFVPGRDMFAEPVEIGCVPRGDRPPRPTPHQLTPDLVGRLAAANKKFSAWLASEPVNARMFLDDPVAALSKGGVELSRADMKAISRAHATVRDEAVLPPGARVTELKVNATSRGKVGDGHPNYEPAAGSKAHGSPAKGPATGPKGPGQIPTRRLCGC